MKKTLITLITLWLVATSHTVLAADVKNGKKLQQKNCMKCHDDGMYT